MKVKFALGVALALLSVPALAAPIAPGFNGSSISANDDGYTNAVSLGFSANFFGTSYSSTYVSNNGYLTFGAGQGTYTPDGLGAGYSGLPIIAAFFADVDTRGANSTLTTYGTGTYAGRNAFGATWDGVGYYQNQSDKLNKFQIILTDRSDIGAGDFDIYFNYDQILWETGSASGGNGGFGGTSAAAGFNAGSNQPGTYYEIPGSRTPGSFLDNGTSPLVQGGNTGVPGQFLFTVRNGTVVVPSVPEPATWAMMITGFGLVGGVMRRRPKTDLATA